MKTLLNILSYNAIYKDAFREVGLLEVMVTCLHRYAALLKAQQDDTGKSEQGFKNILQSITVTVVHRRTAISLSLGSDLIKYVDNNHYVTKETGSLTKIYVKRISMNNNFVYL